MTLLQTLGGLVAALPHAAGISDQALALIGALMTLLVALQGIVMLVARKLPKASPVAAFLGRVGTDLGLWLTGLRRLAAWIAQIFRSGGGGAGGAGAVAGAALWLLVGRKMAPGLPAAWAH